MSDSRLEKFIYAICSMDVSDLPVPLSRIETLWNCLITGETPDFEPLSRNEKYLMAMLDRYDISNLPAPMSRGEKLLYKIAVGETDLSDVPGYLSRYEELLKYLIENSEISEDDFEYVLYTLNQSLYTLYATAEKPVKSAILKGQTLVNLSPFKSLMDVTPSVLNENSVIWYGSVSKEYFNYSMFKPNTKYIVKFGLGTPSRFKGTYISGLNMPNKNGYYTEHNDVFTTPQTIPTEGNLYLKGVDGDVITKEEYSKIEVMIIEYQEGIENWDIPYFEGMQSVKMPVLTTTGKNLFDGKWEIGNIGNNNGLEVGATSNVRSVNYINVEPNTTYKASSSQLKHANVVVWYAYDKDKNFISSLTTSNILTTPSNCKFIRVRTFDSDSTNMSLDCVLQIEQGSIATSYEPYKTNILSTNEDVTLRGVGDVQDTLDCLTGEVTERIGEVIFDGSDDEKWNLWATYPEESAIFRLSKENALKLMKSFNKKGKFMCDKFSTVLTSSLINTGTTYPHAISFSGLDGEYIQLRVYKSLLKSIDVDGLREYLTNEPITVQYELAEKSIKTVDLIIVDQDGNETNLRTFDDTTHVLLQSEVGPNPTAELTVRTKIPTASSTNLLMDDISTEQQQLETTVDEQSNNVDATMIATTEIYEETL